MCYICTCIVKSAKVNKKMPDLANFSKLHQNKLHPSSGTSPFSTIFDFSPSQMPPSKDLVDVINATTIALFVSWVITYGCRAFKICKMCCQIVTMFSERVVAGTSLSFVRDWEKNPLWFYSFSKWEPFPASFSFIFGLSNKHCNFYNKLM